MPSVVTLCYLLFLLVVPIRVWAIEPAAPLSDREVIERLTRVEEGVNSLREGQDSLRQDMQQLRQDINGQMQQLREDVNGQMQQLRTEMIGQMQQLRTEMIGQMQQLRTDMNAQFSYVFQLMIGILGAFAAIVAVTISFAIWDRRTMVRPFENKVKQIEEEISQNRQRLHALLEALRVLSQKDKQVAEVLKQFDLL